MLSVVIEQSTPNYLLPTQNFQGLALSEARFVFLVRRLASYAVKMAIWMSQNPGKVYPRRTV